MFQCLHEDHSGTPAERDGQETRIGFCTAHALKSTLIVRPSGSLYVTSRPLSCCNIAQLAVWIPGSSNGILCP